MQTDIITTVMEDTSTDLVLDYLLDDTFFTHLMTWSQHIRHWTDLAFHLRHLLTTILHKEMSFQLLRMRCPKSRLPLPRLGSVPLTLWSSPHYQNLSLQLHSSSNKVSIPSLRPHLRSSFALFKTKWTLRVWLCKDCWEGSLLKNRSKNKQGRYLKIKDDGLLNKIEEEK